MCQQRLHPSSFCMPAMYDMVTRTARDGVRALVADPRHTLQHTTRQEGHTEWLAGSSTALDPEGEPCLYD